MEVTPGDVIIEPAENRSAPRSQPIQALASLEPQLDDAAVRAAIASAEASNQDPQSITMQDFAQGPQKTQVPEKFLKTDGVVDVEKIQASTRQLDEATQKKEEALRQIEQKSVDDYLEAERKFKNMPNPQRLAAQAPQMIPPAPPLPEGQMTPQQMEEMVRRDYQADPIGTILRLNQLQMERELQPMREREKIEATRSNIAKLAEKDPRIMRQDVFDAVNAKLQSDPEFWKLKNPHKAAWLEVKEEMRLGDVPNGAQAQPSRLSPILGGGSPPSAPSSSVATTLSPATFNTLDLRDKKQEEAGDAAMRALLQGTR